MNFEIFSFIGQCLVVAVFNLLTFLLFRNMYGMRYENRCVYVICFFIVTLCMIGINRLDKVYFCVL